MCIIQDILAPDQAYEGLYGQGNGTANGRAYQQGKYSIFFSYFSVFCMKFHNFSTHTKANIEFNMKFLPINKNFSLSSLSLL